jgi:mannose-6-phosphate isomerase-like protein (cupin superfamily)
VRILKQKIIRAALLKEKLLSEGCFLFENWGAVTSGDTKVSVARARVKPGDATKKHHLEGGVQEIYLITNGKGKVTIGDMEPAEVNAGDVVVIPSGVPQQIANIGATDLVFYCICTPAFTPECYRDDEP